MKTLSKLVFVILTAIAAVHVYWGFGGLWPSKTVDELIRTVVGVPGMTEMFGKGMTLIVAGLIFAAGLVALLASGVIAIGPRWFARLGAGVLTIIFLGRGVMGFLMTPLNIEQTEPFATYDLWLYSPLCLVIGGAFVVLTLKTRTSL